jgi:hypothetical protein
MRFHEEVDQQPLDGDRIARYEHNA